MKKPLAAFLCFINIAFFTSIAKAQSFGTFASGVSLSNCTQSNFFNTSGAAANLLGPAGNLFNNANLGVYTQNSGTLILKGGGVKTSKPASDNVCSVRMHYRIYLQSGSPGAFNIIDLPHLSDCDVPSSQFPGGGGGCSAAGDQLWERTDTTIDITSLAPGKYMLEVYYDVAGSNTSTTGCSDTVLLNNSGNNYKASFSIQSPTFASNNPVTCNGADGFITISGLVAGSTYSVSYTHNGVPASPINLTANGSGRIVIPNLSAGIYSNFLLKINGCTTDLGVGIVLSNPIFIPAFSGIAPFCAGTTAPTLPSSSTNGIVGSWSPAVIDNQNSGSYAFAPTASQCGIAVNITVTVIPRTVPTFSFGTSLTICAGGAVPTLPGTSTNGITGTWNPAVVDNQNSGVYTFTPGAGQCASIATFTVAVNPNITPSFSFGTSLTVCAGGTVPTLPDTSTNGITGTWSPAVVDDQNSGSYTFTPGAGQCATSSTFTVTVNPVLDPAFSFGTSLTICAGSPVPTLPNASTNGVTGIWSPTTVDNQNSGTYSFTPDAGQCAIPTAFTVTINPNITPTFSFGILLTICNGGTVPVLPHTSTNGITGIWTPAVVDNQNAGLYTFTPTAGQCAKTQTFTVNVNPNITPAFSFGTSLAVCAGGTVPALPGTSTNGILGAWSPATVDNQNSGVYIFTPFAGQCATTTTFTVTVNPNITPTFGFGTSLTICAGAPVPTLVGTSTNAITGTWSPATVDNQNSAVYTFTPTTGQCATTTTFTVTVTSNITPTFSSGTSLSICTSGAVPPLPNTSTNGITGTWNPSVVDDQNSGTYTFTPTAGQCATTTSFVVTVNPIITPVFSFGTSLTICAASTAPALPDTSTNGITGTWSPAAVNNQNSGVYIFTPDAGQCANGTSLTVTITPTTTPLFSIGTTLSVCTGGTVPILPGTSTNGIDGTWSPAVIGNQNSAVYTFTPNATPQQCILSQTFAVTVNPIITPAFSFRNSLSICINASVPALPDTSTNGISGTWSPAAIDNQNSGSYTFTPNSGQCATTAKLTVDVNQIPTVVVRGDTTLNDGNLMPATFFTGTPANAIFNWVNSKPSIGLPGSGIGNIPSFSVINRGNEPVISIITVTPQLGGCLGTPRSFNITVDPLNKDVFVPNVFTPNGDGKNDKLYAYGNYIDKLEMRIFNQWGQQIAVINSLSQGWDGTQGGKPQPVGVYVYVLKAVMTDGRIIQLKGSITLLR